LLTYKEQINKREKLLKQSIEDYDDLVSRTGLPSLIDVCIENIFIYLDYNSFI